MSSHNVYKMNLPPRMVDLKEYQIIFMELADIDVGIKKL